MSATITANISPASLDNWMQQNYGRTQATPDEWCWVMNNAIPGGSCPDLGASPDLLANLGITDRLNPPLMSSTSFLDKLRSGQAATASINQGPGGTTFVNTNSAGGAGAVGQGILGMTNCKVCQQVSQNPLLLVVVGVAVWYLFFND